MSCDTAAQTALIEKSTTLSASLQKVNNTGFRGNLDNCLVGLDQTIIFSENSTNYPDR